MQHSSLATARAAGIVVAGFGALMAARWLFQLDAVTRLIPGSSHVGLVNPLLFIVAGLLLCAAARPQPPTAGQARLSALGVAALILLPLGYLFESATGIGLGIDITRPGVVPTAAIPYPGRPSPNASLALLVAALAFWLRGRRPRRAVQLAFVVSALVVCGIGLLGLIGHFLGLETLYQVARFNRMLPPTAFSLSVLGFGLWMLHEASQAFDPKALQQSARRIRRRSVAILMLVAVTGGVAGFAVMRDTFERSVAQDMLLTATTNATSLAHTLEVSLWFPRTVATRPAARQALDRLSSKPDDAGAHEFLQRVADSILTADLTGVEIRAADGARVAQAGVLTALDAQLIQRLANAGPGSFLAWRDGFVLHAETDVRVDGRTVGRVLTEQRMPLFDRLLADIRAVGETSDVAICGRDGARAICAPNRFRPAGFETPMFDAAGQPGLPVTRALLGERGVQFLRDRRGVEVLSAYAPIQPFGLGLAVRTDVDTLYAPLRSRAELLVLALGGIVALAVLAQRSQVRPVLEQLVESQQTVKASQALLARMGRVAGVGGWQIDLASGEHTWTDETRRIHEVGSDFVPTMENAVAFYPPASRPAIEAAVQKAIDRGEPWTLEVPLVTAAGRSIWVRAQGEAELQDGKPVRLTGAIQDITQRVLAEQALLESEARLRTIADSLPIRVAYIDADERYRFNNRASERAFGRTREELYGQTLRAVLGEATYRTVEPHVRSALRGEAVTFQSELAGAGGYLCYEAQYIPQFAADGQSVLGFHAVVSDITRQKLEERRLVELARVDALTGVANRAGFELRLTEAMQRSRTTGTLMALMYLDVDRFKPINDRFGHDVGDALLRAFAGRLAQTLRSTDTIARLGGDEFTVIMEGLPRAEVASAVGAKIVEAMATPFLIEQQALRVTASIGLAFYRGDETSVEAFVKQADVMLYQAKGAGRNNIQAALQDQD